MGNVFRAIWAAITRPSKVEALALRVSELELALHLKCSELEQAEERQREGFRSLHLQLVSAQSTNIERFAHAQHQLDTLAHNDAVLADKLENVWDKVREDGIIPDVGLTFSLEGNSILSPWAEARNGFSSSASSQYNID